MSMLRSIHTLLIWVLALFLYGPVVAAGSDAVPSLEQQVTGLWLYTGLTTGDGVEMPLTGIFLFKDGVFVQQAVFDGEVYEEQGSMAHAGPYMPAEKSVHLVAEQTISIAPTEEPPMSFRANTEHDVTVTREGKNLTLIFGMGTSTVQKFEYVGPGEGDLYALEDGALALVDGYFLLVQGNENGEVTGYGTYEQEGQHLTLNVIRWAEADSSTATNLRDTTMQATFDGQTFTLEDGRSFPVKP